jgi:hypothetical protein
MYNFFVLLSYIVQNKGKNQLCTIPATHQIAALNKNSYLWDSRGYGYHQERGAGGPMASPAAVAPPETMVLEGVKAS